MTEKELIDAGFKKIIVSEEESGMDYPYYFYSLDVTEGLCLISNADDEAKEGNYTVGNFDCGLFTDKIEHVTELIKTLKTWEKQTD
jgi:hypothetical protein